MYRSLVAAALVFAAALPALGATADAPAAAAAAPHAAAQVFASSDVHSDDETNWG